MKRILLLLVIALTPALVSADTCSSTTGLTCPARTNAGALSGGDCVASDTTMTDLWTFSGTAGEVVTIEMSSTAFDPYLVLVDPTGAAVMDDDDAASGSTTARLTYTLTSGGSWTIVANSIGTTAGGSYTLALSCGTDSVPACSYALSETSHDIVAGGGSITIDVSAADGCSWSASSADDWLTIAGGASGTGNGSVTLAVSPNTAASSRAATLQIAGTSVTVTQSALVTSRHRAMKP
jgi:hypothetical protein